jgi:hypothetical protein
MHRRIAAALLISITAVQLWSLACPSLHQVRNHATAPAAHNEHDHGTPPGSSDDSDECLLMAMCSAATLPLITAEIRIVTAPALVFATPSNSVYRNPSLTTPTPPPKYS